MNNIYDILNDIDTDFSEFEEESLSEIEVKKINERLKGKINARKCNTTKNAIVWMGRAAVIMLGCLTIGGGVYAATLYRKNVKNDLRIKASESKVISEEGNKVTKEMYDSETGGKATYEVVYDGASTEAAIDNENLVEKIEKAGIANAEIASISKEDSNLKIGVRFNFENDTDLDSLVEKINEAASEGTCWNATEATGLSLSAKIDGTEFFSWGNEIKSEGNSLYLDFFIDTTMTQDYLDEIEKTREEQAAYLREHPEEVEKFENGASAPLTADSTDEEIAARMAAIEEYQKSLPDPLNSPIEISIDLGKDYGETYTFTTKLDGEFEDSEREHISVNGGSAEFDLDGMYESLTIDSYSMGATGFQLHGTYVSESDWDVINKKCEETGGEYSASLRIRAWDDLGNTYLMMLANYPGDGSTKTTPYGESVVDNFDAALYDHASGLEQFSKGAGIDYCSQWADGISQITFAIEKEVWIQDADRNDSITVELVSDPVTVTLPK
jgi:hypothetical protein